MHPGFRPPAHDLWRIRRSRPRPWQSVAMPERPADARDVRRWPSGPVQLIDTTLCPSCFTTLQASSVRHLRARPLGARRGRPAERGSRGARSGGRPADAHHDDARGAVGARPSGGGVASASSATDAAAHAAPAAVSPAAIPAVVAPILSVPVPASAPAPTPVAQPLPVAAPAAAAAAAPPATGAPAGHPRRLRPPLAPAARACRCCS